jgi:hypothetical protein
MLQSYDRNARLGTTLRADTNERQIFPVEQGYRHHIMNWDS